MSYQGPLLIREPELRWPIVILAAIITTIIAFVAAGLLYVTMTQPVNSSKLNQHERTVMVTPARQTALEPGEAIGVRVLLESIGKDSERANMVLEVTGVRFD